MREHKIYHVFISILCIFYTSTIYGGYQVIDLGGNYVYGTGLNNHNTAIGFVKPLNDVQKTYAFTWSKDTGLKSIGGYVALSINDSGVIVGRIKVDDHYYGAVWENGTWITFTDRQEITSINDKGQCTGLISAQPYIPGPYGPFRDDDIHTPGFIELAIPYNNWVGQGFDINNKGQIVADFGIYGVFYDSDESYKILRAQGSNTPYSINDLGQIVGGCSSTGDISLLRAVYWESPSSNMALMGRLGSGNGAAYNINNQGVAVGRDSDKAFIWSLKTGMIDLNTLIDGNLGINLTNAVYINDYGNILARGINSLNEQHTYLLVVPEPSTLFLILFGIGIIKIKQKKMFLSKN